MTGRIEQIGDSDKSPFLALKYNVVLQFNIPIKWAYIILGK